MPLRFHPPAGFHREVINAPEITTPRRAGIAIAPAQHRAGAHQVELATAHLDAAGITDAHRHRLQRRLTQRLAVQGRAGTGPPIDDRRTFVTDVQRAQLRRAGRQHDVVGRRAAHVVTAFFQPARAGVAQPAIGRA
ncbi:hypothetical protein D3C71_1012050 [compost metagenome]